MTAFLTALETRDLPYIILMVPSVSSRAAISRNATRKGDTLGHDLGKYASRSWRQDRDACRAAIQT